MSKKKINLEEIGSNVTSSAFVVKYNIGIRIICLEFAKQLLELAAENAEGDIVDDTNFSQGKVVINKQSILDTIKQIE